MRTLPINNTRRAWARPREAARVGKSRGLTPTGDANTRDHEQDVDIMTRSDDAIKQMQG